MTLTTLLQAFADHGAIKVFAKVLAENDNSKNQVYLGPDLSALNVLPIGQVRSESGKKQLKASVDFWWLDEAKGIQPARRAQLILYPQYPEVRFSGFLVGCSIAPSKLMTSRQGGRVLFFAIRNDGRIIGFVAAAGSAIARELASRSSQLRRTGVFLELTEGDNDRRALIRALATIHRLGWIDSKRLGPDGGIMPCSAPQCGGYTLEAELGIIPNGRSDPDFLGWEVKQHAVSRFDRPASGGAVTLMTPEPSGGFYKREGVEAFVRKFGYKDATRPKRWNFGGRHFANRPCAATGLTLRLKGFDPVKGVVTDPAQGIVLVTDTGLEAAIWPFTGLMEHWNRKHSRAVYVPSMKRTAPRPQYRFGDLVRLGEGTDFLLLLKAIASSDVYYDPGIKVEYAGPRPKAKKRSQFRISSARLGGLYHQMGCESVI